MVGEDANAVGLADGTGEPAHGLAHHAGLKTDGGIPHLALQLYLGNTRGHGVDHHDIHRPRTYQGLGDIEGVLSAFRLGDHEVCQIDPDHLGIAGVKGVLNIDEHRSAALSLRFSNDTEAEGCFARGLGAIDFAGAPAWESAHAKGEIDGYVARRDDVDLHLIGIAQPHERAFAKLLVNARNREVQCLLCGIACVLFCHDFQSFSFKDNSDGAP